MKLKQSILFLVLVFIISCGGTTTGGNNITEVGNATNPKNAATASATTKALTQATTGLLDATDTLALTTGNYVTIQTEDFDCTLTILSKTLTCSCPEGGSFTRTYDAIFTFNDDSIVLDRDFTTTFDDCMITTCEETITLSGDTSGDMTGTYDRSSAEGEITANSGTASDCSGMTSGTTDFGFEMALAYDDADVAFSGSYCYDGTSLDFNDLDALEAAVDPDGVCDDFGP
jgi:hypothetical protein